MRRRRKVATGENNKDSENTSKCQIKDLTATITTSRDFDMLTNADGSLTKMNHMPDNIDGERSDTNIQYNYRSRVSGESTNRVTTDDTGALKQGKCIYDGMNFSIAIFHFKQ